MTQKLRTIARRCLRRAILSAIQFQSCFWSSPFRTLRLRPWDRSVVFLVLEMDRGWMFFLRGLDLRNHSVVHLFQDRARLLFLKASHSALKQFLRQLAIFEASDGDVDHGCMRRDLAGKLHNDLLVFSLSLFVLALCHERFRYTVVRFLFAGRSGKSMPLTSRAKKEIASGAIRKAAKAVSNGANHAPASP